MRQAAVWFFLCCKRYLKKWSFLVILLALPAASWAVCRVEQEEGQEIRIALYAEETDREKDGESPLEIRLVDNLAERDPKDKGVFRFYLCADEEEVKDQVASRHAECGYVVSGDLRRRLDERDYRRCIRVYSAPSTVLAELSTEVVCAALMELYDREIFLDYILESEVVDQAVSSLAETMGSGALGVDPRGILEDQAGRLYDKWMNNGSTFRFEYGYRDRRGEAETKETGGTLFPVRGIAAVYVFLTGLYSAVMSGYDKERGLFLCLSPGRRRLCSMAVLLAPVCLAAVSGLGAIALGGAAADVGRETGVMAVYVLSVCVFSGLMRAVCRKPGALAVTIPFFLAGSLIFAPVLVDVGRFFPKLGWIERLFLPSWYLRAF